MVMEGIGWKPSSLAGRDGLEVQKYTCSGQGNEQLSKVFRATVKNCPHCQFISQLFSLLNISFN